MFVYVVATPDASKGGTVGGVRVSDVVVDCNFFSPLHGAEAGGVFCPEGSGMCSVGVGWLSPVGACPSSPEWWCYADFDGLGQLLVVQAG